MKESDTPSGADTPNQLPQSPSRQAHIQKEHEAGLGTVATLSPKTEGSGDMLDSTEKNGDSVESSSNEKSAALDIPLRSRGVVKLYILWIPMFMSLIMTGYGFGALTAVSTLPSYIDYFKLSGYGVSSGLIFGMWPITACCTFWIGPIISDRFGRVRAARLAACTFFAGTTLFAFSRHYAMLLVARGLCGAGFIAMQASAPAYVLETCPPLKRGLFAGLLSSMNTVGNCLATSVGIEASRMDSEWGWRLVFIISMMFPAIIAISTFFMPDSPRWLYNDGQEDEALAFLQKYHGSGRLTEVVQVEYAQIAGSVKAARDKGQKRWDLGNLANTKSNRYRLMLALVMALFSQMSGAGLINFLPQSFAQIGYTSASDRLSMALIAYGVGLLATITGCLILDHIGRRRVLIFGPIGISIALIGCMVSASQSGVPLGTIAQASNMSASRANIACFVFFMMLNGLCYQPLMQTYPGEVLSTDQRSTALGFASLIASLCMALNLFTIPIALERIGWYSFLPYATCAAVQSVVWYFVAVETRGRSLEELDVIFEARHPVRASLVRLRRLPGSEQGSGSV